MAKQSKISRAREISLKINEALDAVFQQSTEAHAECMRVQNIGVNLAHMINQGYVTAVNDEGMDMLADTLAELTLVVEHGLSLFLADVQEHRTILEYVTYGENDVTRGMVVEFNRSRTSVKVIDPGSLLAKQDIWISLLWAPKSTIIVH